MCGKNKKCLECSEMQEYAKKLSTFFVRVSAKTCQKCIVISWNIETKCFSFPIKEAGGF